MQKSLQIGHQIARASIVGILTSLSVKNDGDDDTDHRNDGDDDENS